MPLLDNPRHVIFAQELAKGASQKDAYEAAGYKPSKQHASRLATNGYLLARVAELQVAASERTEITIESLIREAAEIQRAAIASGQLSAANAAPISKAKLSGLWVEKRDNTIKKSVRELTDQEIETRLAELRGVDPRTLSDEALADIIARGSDGVAKETPQPVDDEPAALRRRAIGARH